MLTIIAYIVIVGLTVLSILALAATMCAGDIDRIIEKIESERL